jgi:hypothetical protein
MGCIAGIVGGSKAGYLTRVAPNATIRFMKLSRANCAILCAIFAEPTRSNIRWDDFVRVYLALGGEKVQCGSGSVRRFKLNGVRAVFHEPHPQGVMKKYVVEDARDFLTNAGVSPKLIGCDCGDKE